MYFRNIYKTLQQLERDKTKVKKLPQTVMFLFHLHNFVVSCSNSSGGGDYIQNNIFVSKRMSLNPRGALTWDFTKILHPS